MGTVAEVRSRRASEPGATMNGYPRRRFHDWFPVFVSLMLIPCVLVWAQTPEIHDKIYDPAEFIVCTVYVEDNAIAQTCERR